MHFQQSRLQRGVVRGLDDGDDFLRGLDLPFPAVDGFGAGEKIYTGGRLRFHQGRANLSRLSQIGEGAEDDAEVFHAFF